MLTIMYVDIALFATHVDYDLLVRIHQPLSSLLSLALYLLFVSTNSSFMSKYSVTRFTDVITDIWIKFYGLYVHFLTSHLHSHF